jgi:hypothetical protein
VAQRDLSQRQLAAMYGLPRSSAQPGDSRLQDPRRWRGRHRTGPMLEHSRPSTHRVQRLWARSLGAIRSPCGTRAPHRDWLRSWTGICACPPSSPTLPVDLVFNPGLQVVMTSRPGVRTTRGIQVGSSSTAIRRAYPGARLIHHNQLVLGDTYGPGAYYVVRAHGHALTFDLEHGRVSGIFAFRHGTAEMIGSLLCP